MTLDTRRLRLLAIVFFCSIAGILCPRAEAGLVLKLQQNSTTQTFTDGDNDGLISLGSWVSSYNFGTFQLKVGVISNSPGNGIDGAELQTIAISAYNASSVNETLTFTIEDDGFDTPGADGDLRIVRNTVSSSGPLTGTVSAESILFNDRTADASFSGAAGTTPIATISTFGEQSTYMEVVRGPTFGLGTRIVLAAPGRSSNNFDVVTQVPLPEASGFSIWLIAIGIIGLAGTQRKKRLCHK